MRKNIIAGNFKSDIIPIILYLSVTQSLLSTVCWVRSTAKRSLLKEYILCMENQSYEGMVCTLDQGGL